MHRKNYVFTTKMTNNLGRREYILVFTIHEALPYVAWENEKHLYQASMVFKPKGK